MSSRTVRKTDGYLVVIPVRQVVKQWDSTVTFFYQIIDRRYLEEIQRRAVNNKQIWSYIDDVMIFSKKPDQNTLTGVEIASQVMHEMI